MSRQWEHGAAVVDGELRYVSPSQLVSADPDAGGCLRKWHFRKVGRKPEPSSKSQEIGTEGHGQIENYLNTGELLLGPNALAGRQYIPEPGPGLLVEQAIGDGTVMIAGLLVVGFLDLLNARGEYIREDGEIVAEPDTVEVVDWKFTGNFQYAKTSIQIVEATPMIAYGEWAAQKADAAFVRLSHVYFGTRQRQSTKRTGRLPREELIPRWNRNERTALSMIDAAKLSDSNLVDANTRACTSYGGCPHRAYCTAANEKTLIDIFGLTGAKRLTGGEKNMGLLNIPGLAPKVAEAKAELVEAESAIDPALVEAVRLFKASPYGVPMLTGPAARAWALVEGFKFRGGGIAGSGTLGESVIDSVSDLIHASAELADLPAILPPDAPTSDPAKAALPIDDAPVAPAAVATPAPAAPAPKKVKAPTKAELAARVAELEAQLADAPAPAPTVGEIGVQLFVDCRPSWQHIDLGDQVDAWAAQLADTVGADDVRCAGDDTPLGYGKWKGALAAMARAFKFAPGMYYLDTRCELAAEVAGALRGCVDLYVRSGR